jgi:histone acetyltransferase
MPKIYITRLVLDRTHYSLIGIKNGRLIGGITFKPCNKPNVPKFIEVVFCAITFEEQVRGYGSRLMNHMKYWCITNGYLHMLTYADDFAIGYFQRQGFTIDINFDRKYWDIGFLKHYDSATLMHCKIDPNVKWLEITQELRVLRCHVMEKMKELSYQHRIYSGITAFKEKKQVRIDVDKLTGLRLAGWNSTKYKELVSEENQAKLKKMNRELLEEIKMDSDSWPFTEPIDALFPTEAEKYKQEISDPIDLQTIEDNLERGFYITREMFLSDLQRMIDNCKQYNPKDSIYYELGEKIEKNHLKKHQLLVGTHTTTTETNNKNTSS